MFKSFLKRLHLVDSCKFCITNGNEKFERVAAEHKGVSKNKTGVVL